MSAQTHGTQNGHRKLNQFGDYEDVTNMSPEDWSYRWSLDQTKFHMPQVHPMLKKHIEKLTQGRISQKVFVPLCGKTLDMQWLLDQGHEVIGNECADLACKQFFEEQNIPYTSEPLPGVDGVLYTATDGKPIKIYRCDCFALTSKLCGQFDCVWDRGGFVALPVKERTRYANAMRKLMKDNSRYLLDCFLLDNDIFAGPPFNCSENDVKQSFEKLCSVKKLDEKDVFGKWQESWGLKTFVEEVFLLQPK